MRYFVYKRSSFPGDDTVVIIDESSKLVKTVPNRGASYSQSKDTWLDYYNSNRSKEVDGAIIFEICENQFKKFIEQNVIPTNWDW